MISLRSFSAGGGKEMGDWMRSPPTSPSESFLPESSIIAPSDMISISDSPINSAPAGIGGWLTIEWQFGRILASHPNAKFLVAENRKRHGDRYNVAFCDGHLERLQRKKMFAWSPEAYRRFNRDHEPHAPPPVFGREYPLQ